MKKETDKVSLRAIAERAGVSLAATSFALQNRPGVSPATRERILCVAKELGYKPDARIGSWMARVRDAKDKDLLPIAWLNTSEERDAWQRFPFMSPHLDGARERGLELGYKIEEIWCREPGMTMQRLSKILYQRGIEGAIVPFPVRHFRLDWDHLACVTIGDTLLAPRLHRITADITFNLLLALKSLRRIGYRRVGICLARSVDTAANYSIRTMAHDLCASAAKNERVPPLFHPPAWEKGGSHKDKEGEMVKWLKRYRPEVIVGYNNHLEPWVKAAGYRVPEDVGIIHLAVDDDVLDWAGIHSRRHKMGQTAVEWLVSLIRNRQFGVPETPLNILIRGSWQSGRTLRTLLPRKC